jgi:hypothetical protein
VRTDEYGTRYFEYHLRGELVGTRSRTTDGEAWDQALKNERRHGPERTWSRDGVLIFESHWLDGKEHGTARQWSDDGTLIGMYHMQHGTGLDLWRSNRTWVLSEERNQQDGTLHGFTRWWNGDQRTIRDESHYRQGQEHGIFREWNNKGRLRRGFPRYFVGGQRVDKRQYERARQADDALPPYRQEDNSPERPLPAEYLEQVAARIGPRRCGECSHLIGQLFCTACPACEASV